jgi:hypothetical protein
VTDRPDEQAEMSRLLAQARHTEPMPDDVAERMDDVLAGLSHRQAAPGAEPAGVVVSLAARRRRRTAATLVAAAAVVVGSALVAPHVSLPSPSSTSETGGNTAAAANDAGGRPPRDTGQKQGLSPEASPSHRSRATQDGRVVVRPHHFATDARALQARLGNSVRGSESLPSASACAGVPRGADTLAAEYRRAPAALVFRQARGGFQVVELYACGTTRPLRSVTLPAP